MRIYVSHCSTRPWANGRTAQLGKSRMNAKSTESERISSWKSHFRRLLRRVSDSFSCWKPATTGTQLTANILADSFQLKRQINDEWLRLVHKERARQNDAGSRRRVVVGAYGQRPKSVQKTRTNHFLKRMKKVNSPKLTSYWSIKRIASWINSSNIISADKDSHYKEWTWPKPQN